MYSRTLALGLVFAVPLAAQKPPADVPAPGPVLAKSSPAYQALQDGRVDDAATLLRAALAANPADSGAHQLLCRVYYAQDVADEAIRQCELAVSSPAAGKEQDSDNHLWLGRAYGLKARHAGPFSGFKLARKVASSFAKAVELNPSSVAALNDLGEFDVSAPSIVGGGSDKAHALADRMMSRFPGSAHLLLARIAQANHDEKLAESEFKQEVAIQKSSAAWVDLAQFYQSHGRADDAVAAVKSALAADQDHGPAVVDAAIILMELQRQPELAERSLRDYLASHAKSDAAPAFKVRLKLSKLLAARGDTQGADHEVGAATVLASTFTHGIRRVQGQ